MHPDPVTQGSPSVFVVVLNWNGWRDSVPCVESIRESSYPNITIVLVDNGSTDDSVSQIRKTFPDLVVLEMARNLGYAAGNNCGIRYSLEQSADYVLILNNDTVVPKDSIQELVEYAERTPGAALIGPGISDLTTGEFLDLPMAERISLGSIVLTKSPVQRIIRRTRFYRKYFYLGSAPHEVYAIHGSAMLFRRSTLERIGMFDEETFIYWEEFILAEKLRKAGMQTYVVPSIRIIHKGNASISKIGAFRFLENMKSEKYFFDKYLELPFHSRLVINTVRAIGYFGRAVVQADYRKNLPAFVRLLFNSGRDGTGRR